MVKAKEKKHAPQTVAEGRIKDDLRHCAMKLVSLLFWGALAMFFSQVVLAMHRIAGQVGDGLALVVGH